MDEALAWARPPGTGRGASVLQDSATADLNEPVKTSERRRQQGTGTLPSFSRADLCRRLGRIPEVRASYEKALALAQQEPERRFLARRLAELK